MTAESELFELRYTSADARKILSDPDSEAVAIYVLAIHALGAEALHGEEAEMLEVYALLEEKFGLKLPEDTEAKLQAMVTLVGTDAFFEVPHALHATAITLTQGMPDFGADLSVDRASWEEIQWAIFCAALLREEDEEADFDERVMREIILAYKESGMGIEAANDLKLFMRDQRAQLEKDLMLLGVPRSEIQKEFKRVET